jgi:hypothetical protein
MHLLTILTLLCGALVSLQPKEISTDLGAINDRYIVKLKNHVVTYAADNLRASLENYPTHVYSEIGFHGFAGILSADEVAHLQSSDHVCHLYYSVVSNSNYCLLIGRIRRGRRCDSSSHVDYFSRTRPIMRSWPYLFSHRRQRNLCL